MSTSSKGVGSEFLARKSDLMRLRQHLPRLTDVLIVDDNTFDADSLKATLNMMFSYKIETRRAKTLGSALDCVIEKKPDIIFLDDILPPNDNAAQTMPFLRRCGYEGPIVVVSGEMNRRRSHTLIAAGASDVVHKDDLESARVTEALGRAFRLLDESRQD
jgi:DNA-binding NarL/FixJ family response regulator